TVSASLPCGFQIDPAWVSGNRLRPLAGAAYPSTGWPIFRPGIRLPRYFSDETRQEAVAWIAVDFPMRKTRRAEPKNRASGSGPRRDDTAGSRLPQLSPRRKPRIQAG